MYCMYFVYPGANELSVLPESIRQLVALQIFGVGRFYRPSPRARLSAPAALLAVYPTVARMSAVLQLAWLLLVVGACLVVGCAAKAGRRRHAAAPAAIAAAWAPWAQQQLPRGMAPEALKGYLARVGVDADPPGVLLGATFALVV